MITLIDYGASNLASLEGALDRLGLSHLRAESPGQATSEGPLVLPGVGHFDHAAAALRQRGWWEEIPRLVAGGRPLLGICLGLQLLAEASEEAPGVPGLGLLPGRVRRLGPGVKVPHMGWSRVQRRCSHPAVAEVEGGWLYFVHSFALEEGPDTLFAAEHGRSFAAVQGRGRVLGFQPHPEKSGPLGLLLLQRSLAWMGEEPPCS